LIGDRHTDRSERDGQQDAYSEDNLANG